MAKNNARAAGRTTEARLAQTTVHGPDRVKATEDRIRSGLEEFILDDDEIVQSSRGATLGAERTLDDGTTYDELAEFLRSNGRVRLVKGVHFGKDGSMLSSVEARLRQAMLSERRGENRFEKGECRVKAYAKGSTVRTAKGIIKADNDYVQMVCDVPTEEIEA